MGKADETGGIVSEDIMNKNSGSPKKEMSEDRDKRERVLGMVAEPMIVKGPDPELIEMTKNLMKQNESIIRMNEHILNSIMFTPVYRKLEPRSAEERAIAAGLNPLEPGIIEAIKEWIS